jgi:hypothetical protein
LRFARPAATSPSCHDRETGSASAGEIENTMHIEIERVVEEIKQSVGLLRRHL